LFTGPLGSPQADPKWTEADRVWSHRFRLTENFSQSLLMLRLENIVVLACGAFFLSAETI
jgi:hypothetical protein